MPWWSTAECPVRSSSGTVELRIVLLLFRSRFAIWFVLRRLRTRERQAAAARLIQAA